MKVKFRIRESLYAMCDFEITCSSQEEVDKALVEIGENISSDELYAALVNRFGCGNVQADDINDVSIHPEDKIQFWDWEN